jgi:glucose-1-phosphate cytidylyltransferase
MKAVILAGGHGTRLMEETVSIPKPLVTVGNRPILWHIMKILSAQGIDEFIICCGYKGYMIKEYFANYFLHMSDVTFDMSSNEMNVHNRYSESWKVTLVDTGDATATGGRLRRVKEFLNPKERFLFTYGDGVGDIDVEAIVKTAEEYDCLACLTAVQAPGRFGMLDIENNYVASFVEKPESDGNWINGGFFVLKPEVIEYINDDSVSWEKTSLVKIASENQLVCYRHHGFWRPMDMLRDKIFLEELWENEKAPWKIW